MPQPSGAGGLRAWLAVAGVPLLRHQLALARALGVQRLLCLHEADGPPLGDVEGEAALFGLRVQRAANAHALLAQVSAADEVIVLADGLLARAEVIVPLLEAGPAVLVQPVETGLATGFERIDLNHAAAGAMLLPGRLVSRLADLPADVHVPSALLRVALQAGVAQKPLPADAAHGGGWALLRDEAAAEQAEAAFLQLHAPDVARQPPGTRLAAWLARRFAPALLASGNNGLSMAVAGVLALALGLVFGWLVFPALALLGLGLAAVLLGAAGVLGRMVAAGLNPGRPL
ncbi:MAG TPA: hypothetical protein VFF98_02560, partial [Novosphingobium sp.]|nr:hypothetical protein [Novosphingobium sp.]